VNTGAKSEMRKVERIERYRAAQHFKAGAVPAANIRAWAALVD
jgi:hypothetical protein